MSRIEFKVGTTFDVAIAYTPEADLAPATLADTTITSQIRQDDGTLVCDLAVVKAQDNLSFTLSADAGTQGWPFDTAVKWDIRFVDAQFGEFYSDTARLWLVRPQTR